MGNAWAEIETKWQKRWYEAGINEANRDDRPKFMMIFAYPGVTGYLHVGHMRGFSYVDAMTRYRRMLGYNVLFPVGTHATGNGAISLANRVRRRDERTIDYLLANGCPDEKLKELEDPLKVVDFFNQVYVNDYWKRFGFLADWRRFTSTTYPDYGKFIQWQFRKLMEKGLLIQKPYYAPACVNDGPVAIDASETDIQKGGNAETNEYTLLKFRLGDMFLVAATLRPETVYGQTNFWVNPDVEYAKVRHGDETWVMSFESYEKMRYQKEGLEVIGKISGRDLMGVRCIAPVIHREVMVLPAKFCDPNVGTGLVTSVPSDAPDDWIALKNLQDDPDMMASYHLDADEVRAIVPIAIIDTKGWGPMPAVEIVQRMGITKSGDPRLVEAKKEIYKAGFHTGKMNASCREFAGMPVETAKEKIREMMIAAKEADVFYDLSEEVICRCGGKVVISRVPDQWFIDYGNQELTDKSKGQAESMQILPSEYYTNIQGVLDWFRERACVRQGNWLGTRFPFDEKWIIEAISDSTLYPLYYLVSIYVNEGKLKADQMDERLLDFVLLGRGNASEVSRNSGVPVTTLEQIRADVEYWYPLDVNLGGKEHMTVHFPAFLMNHVAIMPERHWPRGIFVNWYVVGKGGKISKSKGGAQPIPGAAELYGVDSLRLYYAHIASPFADVEWDEEVVENYTSKMERIPKTVEEMKSHICKGGLDDIDKWLVSKVNSRIANVRKGMQDFDLRLLANEIYFEMYNDLRWYARRGGCNGDATKRTIDAWIRMMAPITPHVAEELWEAVGGKGFVSLAAFPEKIDEELDVQAEQAEEYLKGAMADINEILKVTGIKPTSINLYTTPAWKQTVYQMGLKMARSKEISVPGLTKAAMSDPSIRTKGKEASDFARKVAEDLVKRSMQELDRMGASFDELRYLRNAAPFMTSELGCDVFVYSADDPSIKDPGRKAKAAQPGRPAIFVE
ncbi:MAG: leucine--tRNA ligase [Methanomassiliicoccales archaeon]|nr:leucine--tRNA ligase [Methanomassiliicoccales archaeon]